MPPFYNYEKLTQILTVTILVKQGPGPVWERVISFMYSTYRRRVNTFAVNDGSSPKKSTEFLQQLFKS